MSRVILVVPTELTTTGKLSQGFLSSCTDGIDPASIVSLTGVNYGVVWPAKTGGWELYYINAGLDGQYFSPTKHTAPRLEAHLFVELPHELFLLIDPSIKKEVENLLGFCEHSVEVKFIPFPVSTS